MANNFKWSTVVKHICTAGAPYGEHHSIRMGARAGGFVIEKLIRPSRTSRALSFLDLLHVYIERFWKQIIYFTWTQLQIVYFKILQCPLEIERFLPKTNHFLLGRLQWDCWDDICSNYSKGIKGTERETQLTLCAFRSWYLKMAVWHITISGYKN